MKKKIDIQYAEYYRDGDRYLECRSCGAFTKTDPSATATTCHECVSELYNAQFPFQQSTSYRRSGRPRGWAFMKVFVDKDGTVFHKGKEQPKLKGTLKPTKPKPKKDKPKLSKAQKETIRLHALSQLHKLKKQLAKAKTKKKQAELKRSIRKQQKLIK